MGVYLHRLRAHIASMAASMAGLDTLVFTGGVGERSAPVRWRASEGLGFLGVELDRAANEAATTDREISTAWSRSEVVRHRGPRRSRNSRVEYARSSLGAETDRQRAAMLVGK